MEDLATMQDLCQSDVPLARSIGFLDMLCDRFGVEQIRTIPNNVLAKVLGVLPSTIAMAWQKQMNLQSPADVSETYAEGLECTAAVA
jgi:hypothetical protein